MGLTKFLASSPFILVVSCLALAACSFSPFHHNKQIAELTIEKIGQTRDSEQDERCSKFQPTADQLKQFFSKAVPVTQRIVLHDWYSPCYAEGTVAFVDGWPWDWTVYSGGTATITWAGEDTVYLYNGRDNGWFDPEACSYGGSGEDCVILGS